jgi:hypothetical protein
MIIHQPNIYSVVLDPDAPFEFGLPCDESIAQRGRDHEHTVRVREECPILPSSWLVVCLHKDATARRSISPHPADMEREPRAEK